MSYPEGSTPWSCLKHWAEKQLCYMNLNPIPQTRKKRWRVKVKGFKYNEKWLRIYAALRHCHECTVLASDYANHAARIKRPIVRSNTLDLALLWANAQILKQTTHTKRKDR